MKVVVSLTTIPSRFKYTSVIVKSLCGQACHEVWLNIPKKYNRFPEWDGSIPPEFINLDPKFKLNIMDKDYGPGTKFIGPALQLDPDDIIIYVDDDTNYSPKLATNLLKWWKTDQVSAWGLSGFLFKNYFKGQYPRQHGAEVDVLEGYGGVLVKAGWVQKVLPEFEELLEVTWHDDMILCNLLSKLGIPRRTLFTPDMNLTDISQYQYGFESDALHYVAGGSHTENNKKILKGFIDKGKMYYSFNVASLEN